MNLFVCLLLLTVSLGGARAGEEFCDIIPSRDPFPLVHLTTPTNRAVRSANTDFYCEKFKEFNQCMAKGGKPRTAAGNSTSEIEVIIEELQKLCTNSESGHFCDIEPNDPFPELSTVANRVVRSADQHQKTNNQTNKDACQKVKEYKACIAKGGKPRTGTGNSTEEINVIYAKLQNECKNSALGFCDTTPGGDPPSTRSSVVQHLKANNQADEDVCKSFKEYNDCIARGGRRKETVTEEILEKLQKQCNNGEGLKSNIGVLLVAAMMVVVRHFL